MITITIKGLSKEAHQALKKRAATHGRSLNTEAIAVLESSVRSQPVDNEALIERARQFRNSLQFKVTAADLRRFKEKGRA
ncbi:MAG TPA: Arc family DNA-binding protein [Candidatus Acidoferrales bacterium]|jgi:plasmid stability protein|nr:Arc family DNA-binding protein [Candidatus Acidoferrales bacterium]